MSRQYILFAITLLTGIIVLPAELPAQNSATSSPKSYSIRKKVNPPILNVSNIQFVDQTGNAAIDATEQCHINFDVSNEGTGDGNGCIAKVTIQGQGKGISAGTVRIPSIKPGQSVPVSIPIYSTINTEDGSVQLTVKVDEPNGFGADPFSLDVNTKSFEEPLVKVADYAVTSENSNRLTRKDKFNLQILLQNEKYGKAEDVRVRITLPEHIMPVSGEMFTSFNTIGPGETKSIDLSLISNDRYNASTIPIRVDISEKYGKYAQSRTIELEFDQALATNRITVEEKPQGPKSEIRKVTLTSDVDKDIPTSDIINDKTFAVIIANEKYENDPPVNYAINDGRIFRDYCEKALGLPEDNIHYIENATYGVMNREFLWLKNITAAYKKTKIIFYYAGHGVPDDSSKQAYLLPVDGMGSDPGMNVNCSTEKVYAQLASFDCDCAVVFLDACFSGAKRDGNNVTVSRSVRLAPRETKLSGGNVVVFSAASNDETAYQYDEQHHGLFTYFLLKKLKENNGKVTLGELSQYIKDQVRQKSVVVNSHSQTPTVIASPALNRTWENKTL